MIKFFDDHGLESMVEKGNLTVFENSNISETRMATPIKVGMHAQYIDLYLLVFFSRFQLIKFFDDHGQKGKFGLFLKVAISLKPEWRHPSKLVHSFRFCLYTVIIYA